MSHGIPLSQVLLLIGAISVSSLAINARVYGLRRGLATMAGHMAVVSSVLMLAWWAA